MRRLAALSFLWLLCSCGPDRVAGGSGTSTDNVVTARILSVDSIASVLPDGDTGAYPLFVAIESNTLSFDSAHPDGRDLRVTDSDNNPLPFDLREWNAVTRHGRMWVRLPRFQRGSNQKIALRVGRDSTVPRTDSTATWNGIPDSVRRKVSSILLSDFEVDSTLLNLPCRCNNWYTSASASTMVDPAKTGIENAGRGRLGRAFHLAYFGGVMPNWALVGTQLGAKPFHRFSGLDSITFWARGSGYLRIAVENRYDPYNLTKAWQIYGVGTEWTRYSVKPSDFMAMELYSYGWEIVKDQVNTLTFFAQNGADLWIDDIRLYGISPAEIR